MSWKTFVLVFILALSGTVFSLPASAVSNQASVHSYSSISGSPLLSSAARLYFAYRDWLASGMISSVTQAFQPGSSSNPPDLTPPGAVRFIIDQSYMPQSETSVAVDPNNSSRVVGGFNDARFFFCGLLNSSACPSGYALSLSGFSVSLDSGKSVAKSSDIPAIAVTEFNATSHQNYNGLLISWGDPSVVAGPKGQFYYSSLAIDPITGANGIMIAVSNQNLSSSSATCETQLSSPTSNQCWTAAFVSGNLTFQCTKGSCFNTSFEDKDLSAVDMNPSSPYYGSIYVAWDHFYSDGTSSSYVARCSQNLQCTMVSGGSSALVSGNDKFVAFTTPSVGRDGRVYVSWCNYGTATTIGPVFCKIASSSAGGNSFGSPSSILSFMGSGTTYPTYSVTLGFATEQFRTASIPYMVTDPTNANNVYFTISACTQGSYFNFKLHSLPADNPGNCGASAIIFASSSDGGITWKSRVVSGQGVNTQPSIAVDPSNGVVVLTYYTTQFDPFNHRIDVVALISNDHGNTFSMRRVTGTSNEPDSDPSYYDYIAPGGFGGSFVVPQYGDYFQAAALNGKVYVLYTANYVPEQGTYQTDPFLSVVLEVPPTLKLGLAPASRGFAPQGSSNSGADISYASPGTVVPFNASGFTPNTSFSLTIDWDGLQVVLSSGTVSSNGFISGSFTVPNIQSRVYTITASDSAGVSASTQFGIGQISTSPIQQAIKSLSSSISANFTSIQSSISQLGQSLKGSLDSISSQVSQVSTALGTLSTSLSNDFSQLSSTLSSVSNSITSGFSSLQKANQQLNATLSGQISSAQKAVQDSLNNISSQLSNASNLATGTLGLSAVVLVLLVYTALRVRKK